MDDQLWRRRAVQLVIFGRHQLPGELELLQAGLNLIHREQPIARDQRVDVHRGLRRRGDLCRGGRAAQQGDTEEGGKSAHDMILDGSMF